MRLYRWTHFVFLLEIDWKRCKVIVPDNTAFGLTINTGFALPGLTMVRSRLRLSITTNDAIRNETTLMRIPTHGPPTHPGEMLIEEFLKPLGMTQTELAERLGVSYPRINEIIHGKRSITPDTALRLEQLLGMEAQFWLNLQLAWDLYHAMHSPAAAEIRKIERLPALATP